METNWQARLRWLFSSEDGAKDRLLPRWMFLRGLGLIYFSAFYPLLFQIKGLIGPEGILPANEYLQALTKLGATRFWYAPTLFWFSSSNHALMVVCWVGIAASLLLVLNVWPRATLLVCFMCFLSFIAAAQDFSSYQSDGMLLEAGFLSLFFAPRGLRPGMGVNSPPVRASLFLLNWEWFRIYFESGMVKLASGEPQWRNFTAMDEYYQNGPLPTWIGWYVQHLPHRFHAFATGLTLVLELGLVWMLFLPRRWRIVCFFIVTGWQIPVIYTANYTFLNYIVTLLGVLLLDDRFLERWLPKWLLSKLGWQHETYAGESAGRAQGLKPMTLFRRVTARLKSHPDTRPLNAGLPAGHGEGPANEDRSPDSVPERSPAFTFYGTLKVAVTSAMLLWIFYATTVQMIWIVEPTRLFPTAPVGLLEPFRIANRYGLFAVMTRGRYEIEFQGSNDGQNWTAYPFRYKPQDVTKAPGIYAPYQPRFEWNLWFASLDFWRNNMFVVSTEERLLAGAPPVLELFKSDPFAEAPPKYVRAVIWQYWFTSMGEKRETGNWWRREFGGLYAPELTIAPNGKLNVLAWPPQVPPRQ